MNSITKNYSIEMSGLTRAEREARIQELDRQINKARKKLKALMEQGAGKLFANADLLIDKYIQDLRAKREKLARSL